MRKLAALMVAALLLTGIMLCALWRLRREPDIPPTIANALVAIPPIRNFGQIGVEQLALATFGLMNRTDSKIDIIRIVPQCSCLTTHCADRGVRPSSTVTLTIRYTDFTQSVGPFRKFVTVLYRTKGRPTIHSLRVFVAGDSIPAVPFYVYPNRLSVGRVARGQSVSAVIYFRGDRDLLVSLPKRFRIIPSQTVSKYLAAVGMSKATADESVRLLLSVPGDARLGPFKTHLMLKCLGYYPVT
ncbi:MAG: DUF1573 domain-containing protein, partial [Phycisphaerae bacterium]